ncbi:phage minor head protein [Neptunitalea chrysea]|uniref:phage minor head protein n=1 Tax=Neptunitalea chrysea TaxID=1647581 RepID=UPI002491807C|nr:phage minor head protein [Neptunitalea chrysea]
MHEGTLKPEQLNQELITETYNDIAKAAKQGYGKEWTSFPADGKGSLPAELKKNIYAFSGVKTYAQLEAINELLYDKDGKLRPYNEFEVLARKHNRQYNKNYLQAEYQTARTAAQMAEKWERLQESKHLFPNLKYQTVGDDRVRADHERLDGIIKPIDDSFWSKYYPPLDWRCRCDVVATAEPINQYKEEDLPPVQFKGNVGKDKEIFTRKGNFFKLAAGKENVQRNMELSKLNAPYETAFKSGGKKVQVSLFKDEEDFEQNYNAAMVLADQLAIDVFIRPHINVDGHKNPEYLINNKLSDLKWKFKTDNYKGISNAFNAAKKQDLESIVFDFSYAFKNLDIEKVKDAVAMKVNANSGKRYEGLYFIYGSKAVYVTREEILNNQLLEKLKTIKADS